MISALFSTVYGSVVGFVQKYLLVGAGVVILALGSFAGWQVYKNKSLQVDLSEIRLEQIANEVEIGSLKAVIKVKDFEIDQAKKSAEAANIRADELEAENERLDQVREDIVNAPDSQNRTVGPILERTLDSIGMRK